MSVLVGFIGQALYQADVWAQPASEQHALSTSAHVPRPHTVAEWDQPPPPLFFNPTRPTIKRCTPQRRPRLKHPTDQRSSTSTALIKGPHATLQIQRPRPRVRLVHEASRHALPPTELVPNLITNPHASSTVLYSKRTMKPEIQLYKPIHNKELDSASKNPNPRIESFRFVRHKKAFRENSERFLALRLCEWHPWASNSEEVDASIFAKTIFAVPRPIRGRVVR